jgi:hypothetical protein
MGSGLPQFGFPRRFAIGVIVLKERSGFSIAVHPPTVAGDPSGSGEAFIEFYFKDFFSKNQ